MSNGSFKIKPDRTMDGHLIYEGMPLYDQMGNAGVAKYQPTYGYADANDCDYAICVDGRTGSDASNCFAELRWAEQHRRIEHARIHGEATND